MSQFPPGTHHLPGGVLHVVPPETPLSRSLRISLRGHERLVSPMVGTPVALPTRSRRDFGGKRRETRISVDLGEQVAVTAVLMPRDGSPIRLFVGGVEVIPERSVLENFYRRTSGKRKEKTINRLVLRSERPSGDIHTSLRHFEDFFAVDTNRCVIDRLPVGITSVIVGSVVPVPEARQIMVSYRHLRTWARPVPAGIDATEALGWVQAIALIESAKTPTPKTEQLLVVDAHLGRLDEFNARESALPGGTFLPANWKLMYATSDAGSEEFLPNAMLAAADRASRLARRELEQAGLPPTWFHRSA
jgi:hypothetical protein